MRRSDTYVFGTAPSLLALELAPSIPPGGRVLDVGCGEGRDSVFFASRGFEVVGVDPSAAGLRKAARLAEERGVQVAWVEATPPSLPVSGRFDLVYSCGAIHYVPRRDRRRLFRTLRSLTAVGGREAHIVFTDRWIYRERGELIDYFTPGELASAFAPGEILRREERMISCAQDGRPHLHSVELLIAARLDPGP